MLLRLETTLEASFQRKVLASNETTQKAGPGSLKVDLKISGLHKCEYFVNESAPHATHDDFRAKYRHDRNKLGRHLNDITWRLESKTRIETQMDSSNFQLLSSLTSGLRGSVYRITHKGYISFFTLHEEVSIPDTARAFNQRKRKSGDQKRS